MMAVARALCPTRNINGCTGHVPSQSWVNAGGGEKFSASYFWCPGGCIVAKNHLHSVKEKIILGKKIPFLPKKGEPAATRLPKDTHQSAIGPPKGSPILSYHSQSQGPSWTLQLQITKDSAGSSSDQQCCRPSNMSTVWYGYIPQGIFLDKP